MNRVCIRLECLKIAASIKDVSSECVIDVADKIYKYATRDEQSKAPPIVNRYQDIIICHE